MAKNLKQPLATVLMPVYNGEKYLIEAIESILAQTYDRFEFLIIEDGSTDLTPQIIKKYKDRRIKLITHPHNKGLVYSLNEGLNKSKGKYVARMDADDICDPERLNAQIQFLERNPEYGLVGSMYCVIDEQGKPLVVEQAIFDDSDIKILLGFRSAFCHGTVTMRRSTLLENNLKYNETIKYAEDYDLWTRFARVSKLRNLPRILYYWRKMSTSKSYKERVELIKEAEKIARQYRNRMGGNIISYSNLTEYKAKFKKYAIESIKISSIQVKTKLSHGYQLFLLNYGLLMLARFKPIQSVYLIWLSFSLNPKTYLEWIYLSVKFLQNRY